MIIKDQQKISKDESWEKIDEGISIYRWTYVIYLVYWNSEDNDERRIRQPNPHHTYVQSLQLHWRKSPHQRLTL